MTKGSPKNLPKHHSIDPRVQHAGKAGKHTNENLNVTKGRKRKPKRQKPKQSRWEDE